ncbi:MAG: LCP family protein [Acidimicrobiia bacterium]
MGNNGLVAAMLSALIPGLGQGYMGRWWRAALFALPLVAGVAIGTVMLDLSTFDLIGYAVRPTVLKTILIVNLAVVVWRVLAITDAFSLSHARAAWWRIGVVVALCAAVTAPHVVVAQYTLDAAHALDEVFVADAEVQPRRFVFDEDPYLSDDVEVLPTVPDPVVVKPAFVPGVDRLDPSLAGSGDQRTDETYVPFRDRAVGNRFDRTADGDNRIAVLLAGGDGGPGRSGSRTDSINVVTFDVTTGKAAIFGFPRNMTHVPLPDRWSTAFVDLEKRLTPWKERRQWTDHNKDGEPDQFVPCHCFPDQINAIYPFTREWTETYPNEREPGLAALRDVLELMLGFEIDHYAFVNMAGFVNVVNALGGVDVYVTRGVSIEMSPAREGEEWHTVSVGRGWRHLNGLDALGYVRERRSSNDYVRMQRQRCLLKAVAAKATPANILKRFSQLSKAMANSVKTDIPLSDLPILLERTASLDFDDIATVGFVPPFYTPVLDHRGKPTPDIARIQAMVRLALRADSDTAFESGEDSECQV